MEDTIMEVNLCPSSNFGQASCSVHIDGSEGGFFSSVENLAVVRLEHSVTAVCPENGEIQYTTIIPDKSIEYNRKMQSKIPLDAGHNVGKFEYKDNSLPTVHKPLFQSHTASQVPGLYNIKNKTKVLLPRREDLATSEKVVQEEPSRSRKRKNPDTLDSEAEVEKKPRKNKQWSLMSMKKAIIAVRNGMRVRRAAKEFEVPRTTLKYKLDGRAPLPCDIELSTNDLSDKITEAKKEYMEAKKAKRESLPPQGKQPKDKISPDTGQKNSDVKKPSGETREKNRVKPSSNDVRVQHTRNLRANSNILEKGVVIQQEKVTESIKKPVIPQNNKSVKETNAPDSNQKNSQTKQSSCGKDLRSRNEQQDSKNEEGMNYEDKKIFKLWSEEAMENAIRAVEKGSKIRIAAIKFGIPRSTLGRRLATAGFKRSQFVPKSDLQANVSGTVVGVRQSPRRLRRSPMSDTAQKDPGTQLFDDKTLLRNEERKHVEKEVIVNTRSEDKMDAAKARGRQKVNNKSSSSITEDRKNVEKEVIVNTLSEDRMDAAKARGRQKVNNKSSSSITEQRKNVEKEVIVNTPAEDKTDAVKPKGRHKVKAWSEESMEKALEAVEEGMSLCSATKKFNLPQASLKTRKYKQDNTSTRNEGPEPHITSEDEDQIVDYVNDCARFGIFNIKQIGLLLTAEAAEKKLVWDIKKQGLPSEEWWESFCSRRGSHFKNVDMMKPNQRIKLTEARLSLFYDKLSAIKNSSQYHQALVNCSDCRTFTVQEFKYDLDNVTQWVNDSHGEGTCACRRTEMDSKNKLVSTICCASAAGNSIPPMFVYHTENNYKIPASGFVGPFGAIHFVHHVHDLTRKSDFYFKWFEEVFLKYAPQSRPLILLFDPDTAFITPEFIQLAHKNEIVLLGLPPFSAHVTQPLNRTVFPALKKGFSFTSSLFKRIFVKGVNFNNFARCFKVAWNSSVNAALIKTGFAGAGIHPINRKVIFK